MELNIWLVTLGFTDQKQLSMCDSLIQNTQDSLQTWFPANHSMRTIPIICMMQYQAMLHVM